MVTVDGHIRCGKCGETKPPSAFSHSIVLQGYGRCRDCAREAQRSAQKRDPERFRGYRKSFVERSPDAAKASQKKWRTKKHVQYLTNGPSKATIRCSACKETKPIAAFISSVVARGSGACRACKQVAKRDYERENRDRSNAAQRARHARRGDEFRASRREHYRNNRETYRNYNLGKYGLTAADYDARLASQGGRCACCGGTENPNGKRLFVDHDHDTGAIRGLLCHKCNAGIGALGDDIEGVRRALAYLERAAQQPSMRASPALRINLLQGAN